MSDEKICKKLDRIIVLLERMQDRLPIDTQTKVQEIFDGGSQDAPKMTNKHITQSPGRDVYFVYCDNCKKWAGITYKSECAFLCIDCSNVQPHVPDSGNAECLGTHALGREVESKKAAKINQYSARPASQKLVIGSIKPSAEYYDAWCVGCGIRVGYSGIPTLDIVCEECNNNAAAKMIDQDLRGARVAPLGADAPIAKKPSPAEHGEKLYKMAQAFVNDFKVVNREDLIGHYGADPSKKDGFFSKFKKKNPGARV